MKAYVVAILIGDWEFLQDGVMIGPGCLDLEYRSKSIAEEAFPPLSARIEAMQDLPTGWVIGVEEILHRGINGQCIKEASVSPHHVEAQVRRCIGYILGRWYRPDIPC